MFPGTTGSKQLTKVEEGAQGGPDPGWGETTFPFCEPPWSGIRTLFLAIRQRLRTEPVPFGSETQPPPASHR